MKNQFACEICLIFRVNRQSTDIVTVIIKLQFSSFSLHRRLKFCELFNHCSSLDFHTSMNDSENVKTFPQNSPRSICINAEQNWSVGRRTSSSGEWLIIEMDFEDLQLKVCRFRASESLENYCSVWKFNWGKVDDKWKFKI